MTTAGSENILLAGGRTDTRPQSATRNPQSLSALVITKNEAENIRECLASLQWVDEIVVVDAESTDATVAQAEAFTNKIFVRRWEGFSAAKNFALAQCTGEWVLWIDADERVTPELRDEIIATLAGGPTANGYEIPRLANFLGKWIRHGGWYPGYVLRLFRRQLGRFNQKQVHEGVQLDGRVGRLSNPLLHYTDRDLWHYFEKFNHYTSLAAEELFRQGKRFHLWDLLFRPFWFFLRMYVFKAGFLDGLQGFILASLSATYVFAKYAKLWEKQKGNTGFH
ncbi:MAG: glycosyltransferase family 2 protein [candidate division KSB1 bacterium]|nr:glycosyltransferase family 2 protein [candidate division KSB1 bacterium]MDZ7304931.1 glycosyltransferase family 2 protein [candidate division KSB1 bacterium]MDZ7311649.1 glycosyltransferase family 2 protein [candidate division KSB1 bacterium]